MKKTKTIISLLLLLLVLTGTLGNQHPKLIGHYYADFSNTAYYNGYINFNENTFTLKHFNLLPYTGTIKYYENNTCLESNFDSDIVFSIQTKDINKDTIPFSIHNKKSASYLHISSGTGKFIKVK